MDPKSLSALGLLNDLRHAALDALAAKHKFPALLLFYSFIDICASLAATERTSNRARFESYLNSFYYPGWHTYTSLDLWAARSSLIHAFSPLGDYTQNGKGAKPIFYYSWPQGPEKIEVLLRQRGYTEFFLIDIDDIKTIAILSFNSFWSKVESDAAFEQQFLLNSQHLLKDHEQLQLEDWLMFVDQATKATGLGS